MGIGWMDKSLSVCAAVLQLATRKAAKSQLQYPVLNIAIDAMRPLLLAVENLLNYILSRVHRSRSVCFLFFSGCVF